MNPPFSGVIVWDLDGTLGVFDQLALWNRSPAQSLLMIQARPDLEAALNELTSLGFIHRVLTMATSRYAEMALATLQLRHHFIAVEGYGQRGKGDVVGIAEEMEIPAQRWGASMLFIGDHPMMDPPRDPRVLFHYEPWAIERSALAVVAMVRELLDRGDGDLARGFTRWHEATARRSWWDRLRFRRRSSNHFEPTERELADHGWMVLVNRKEECPVIAFRERPIIPANPVMIPLPLPEANPIDSNSDIDE